MADYIIIGAGIVGLAVAHELATKGHHVAVLEKENAEAGHQTGNNSGVIHSGLYYKPGSLKATLAKQGAESMLNFAREHGVKSENCGKLVTATDASELEELQRLFRRGQENGVPCRLVTPAEAKEIEPHVSTAGALFVESTGIVDYRGICSTLVGLIEGLGGDVIFNRRVTRISNEHERVVVSAGGDRFEADFLINCAGLHSDRIARLAGISPTVRIIPFRGEYFELKPEKQHLVKGLIYPVPDPRFPFLGVHLTKLVNGGVHAGPNAVFAFAREGYRWRDINVRDLIDSATWPGLWKLAGSFIGPAFDETVRSLSREKFAASLRKLVPSIQAADLQPTHAGVRAQAMNRDGSMVDDFYFESAPRQIHLLNAPSPAATAAFEIAKHVARRADASLEKESSV